MNSTSKLFKSMLIAASYLIETSAGSVPSPELSGPSADLCEKQLRPCDRSAESGIAVRNSSNPDASSTPGQAGLGSSPNDPVDTQGPGLISRNARGIDADGGEDVCKIRFDESSGPRSEQPPGR